MKRTYMIMLITIFIFALTSCSSGKGLLLGFDSPESFPPLETKERAPQTEPPATEPPYNPIPDTPKPVHSEFYVEDVNADDVVIYFNEVALGMDANGYSRTLQRWNSTIKYQITGMPTEDDKALLESVFEFLNSIEGFHGIEQAQTQAEVNFQIHFGNEYELMGFFGQSYLGHDGASIYYQEEDDINKAIIYCRTDLDQYMRNAAILKHVYKSLGILQYSTLRTDSAIYSGPTEAQMFTDVDDLILKLMYNPRMLYGMNSADAERVIRQLYY